MLDSIFINKIKAEKDNSGSFKGTVFNDIIPVEIQKEFDFDDIDNVFELQVNGKFEFEEIDGLTLVRLLNLSLTDGNRIINLDLDKLDGNEIYELEESLAGAVDDKNEVDGEYYE